MTRQIKHQRQMRSSRYKKRFNFYDAGSRNVSRIIQSQTFKTAVQKQIDRELYPEARYERVEADAKIMKLKKKQEAKPNKYIKYDEKQIKARLYQLLFETEKIEGKPTTNIKKLTIIIHSEKGAEKGKYFDFLRAGSLWKNVGKWEETKPEKNVMIQVLFKDNYENDVSEEITELLDAYNKRYIKETALYSTIEPVEFTTLEL